MSIGHITYWLAGLWVSSIVLSVITGMIHHTQYHPLIAASAMGLVWCVLRYYNTAQYRVIDYPVLGVCILLGVGSYSGLKDVLVMIDVVGIVWMVSGLSALAMIIILMMRGRMQHTNGMRSDPPYL